MEQEKHTSVPTDPLAAQTDFVVRALDWLTSNAHLVKALYDASEPISDKHFKTEIAKAFQLQDYVYYALLLYQIIMREHERFDSFDPRKGCALSDRYYTMLKKGVHARRILLRMPVVQCYNDSVAKRALEEQFRVNASKNSSNPLEKGGDPLFSKVRRYACHARLRKVWAKKKRRLRYRRY